MNPVYIVKRPNIVQFSVFNFARFQPFSFTATENGQTTFAPLPAVPKAMWVFINGTGQNQAKTPVADFTFEGLNLILSEGIDAGDTVYGVLQY